MTSDDILKDLTAIFRDVLDEDDIELSASSTANDIEEWDSLTHIQLVVAVEKFYKIKFSSSEIYGFENVGDMCEAIRSKVET